MTDKRKKIMFLCPMLHQGGFERVCVDTARLLADTYDITIVIFSSDDWFYNTDGLKVVNIDVPSAEGKVRKILNVFRRARKVKALKKELGTDISYSFGTTASYVNLLSHTGEKIICGIHGSIEVENKKRMVQFDKRSSTVLCCSRGIQSALRAGQGLTNNCYVFNPVDVDDIRRRGMEKVSDLPYSEVPDAQVIISVGREDPQKGYWHLIRAFASVHEKMPGARLVILGSGEFAGYKSLVSALGLDEYVDFPGVRSNPMPYMKAASLYVLPSNHEGFPVAMAEAMALGVPVIAADCPTGPREILLSDQDYEMREQNDPSYNRSSSAVDGEYGILVPYLSPEEDLTSTEIPAEDELLADQISRILGDKALLEHYGARSSKRADDYSPSAYKKAICEVFDRL